MSRLGADGLLLTTAFLWGVTFVAQKTPSATMPPLAFVAARFAVSAVALAPFALWEFRRKPHAPGPRRMAARARHRPHALPRHEPAAGGDRDDERHQCRLPHRLLCRADALRRLGAVGARRRAPLVVAASLRLAPRRLAARLRRRTGSPPTISATALVLLADFAWATGIALTPLFLAALRPAAPARLRPICWSAPRLAALSSAVFETVEPAPSRPPRRRSCSPGIVSGALAYTIQIFAQALHAARRGGADPVARKRVRRARRRAHARRASDRGRRGRLRPYSRRGGRGRARAGALAKRDTARERRPSSDGIENLDDWLRARRRVQFRQNRNSPCYPLLTGERGPRGARI